MRAYRRGLVAWLVVGVASACSPTTRPLASGGPAQPPTLVVGEGSSTGPSRSPAGPVASSSLAPLPPHEVLAGPTVRGAFDLATDGSVIAWSSGSVDADAPDLWRLDPAGGAPIRVFRSRARGAILANLAVHDGTYAFAEITPLADGTRTWRLLLVDRGGSVHVLDVNDVPADQTGILPMAAISDAGVLWATNHAAAVGGPRCELHYAALSGLRARVVAAAPCARTELWYPRSDGARFVYGTVEYPADGAPDQRHVYLVDESNLTDPRRLDPDGLASLPALSGDTVVWKAAPPGLNMFSPAGLVQLHLSSSDPPRAVAFPDVDPPLLTTPTIGPRYLVGDDAAGGAVTAWDLSAAVPVPIDRLGSSDPGFLSGARLSGDVLAWFYTSTTQGGGRREVRWLWLPKD